MTRRPRRLTQLVTGLVGYAVSMALMMRAGLGSMPWDVFHQGVAGRAGLSVGAVTVLVAAGVLLLWIPLRERPGLGTLANVVVIGATVDLALAVLPAPEAPWLRVGYAVAGIVLNAAATAAYIGVGLGPGPRDGLMTGLAARTGLSVRLVRTAIEVTVVLVGWALGGVFGVVTVAYALAVGPLVQWFLPRLTVAAPGPVSRSRGTASPRCSDPS
ncbi:YczE/YyaS/YitT family protein [Pseudonocardia spirodelae]|uniref:Membrane protein YczE n=1 Tax=Pseudonocardia spirodelae TaxID=3133431 RepID=A0ABU8T461_9PSEU